MTCYSPQIPNNTVSVDTKTGKLFRYAFQMDNIMINGTALSPLDAFFIFPDPVFESFPGNKEKSLQKTEYLTINVSTICFQLSFLAKFLHNALYRHNFQFHILAEFLMTT